MSEKHVIEIGIDSPFLILWAQFNGVKVELFAAFLLLFGASRRKLIVCERRHRLSLLTDTRLEPFIWALCWAQMILYLADLAMINRPFCTRRYGSQMNVLTELKE